MESLYKDFFFSFVMIPSIYKLNNIDIDYLKDIGKTTLTKSFIVNDFVDKFYLHNLLGCIKKQLIIDYPDRVKETDYIEVWFKDTSPNMNWHFDCNEKMRIDKHIIINPKLSCILYLDNHSAPTTIIKMDKTQYKYRDVTTDIDMTIVTPEEKKLLIFDSKYIHCCLNTDINSEINNRAIIAFNIWDSKEKIEHEQLPYTNEIIDYTKNDIDITMIGKIDNNIYLKENDEIRNIEIYNLIFNEFISDNISDIISKNNTKQDFRIIYDKDYNIRKGKNEIILHHNLKNLEINEDIIKMRNGELSYNRFTQRHKFDTYIKQTTCDWIINELSLQPSESWETDRHNKYPSTDIKIDKIESIKMFVLSHFRDICLQIQESYYLKNISFNIIDAFVAKYEENKQSFLEMHTDGSDITINICLNNDFTDGGVYFEDGVVVKMNKGDMIIHSGKIKHAGIPITSGIRYILVMFLEIID